MAADGEETSTKDGEEATVNGGETPVNSDETHVNGGIAAVNGDETTAISEISEAEGGPAVKKRKIEVNSWFFKLHGFQHQIKKILSLLPENLLNFNGRIQYCEDFKTYITKFLDNTIKKKEIEYSGKKVKDHLSIEYIHNYTVNNSKPDKKSFFGIFSSKIKK